MALNSLVWKIWPFPRCLCTSECEHSFSSLVTMWSVLSLCRGYRPCSYKKYRNSWGTLHTELVVSSINSFWTTKYNGIYNASCKDLWDNIYTWYFIGKGHIWSKWSFWLTEAYFRQIDNHFRQICNFLNRRATILYQYATSTINRCLFLTDMQLFRQTYNCFRHTKNCSQPTCNFFDRNTTILY